MSVQQLEQRFPEILTNYPGAGLVYLFGSRATGNAGPTSDYDLGVVVDRDGVEYEAHVMSVYGDYLPVLRAQREEILRGGERGTGIQRYRKALGRTRRALDEIRSTRG
jgi:hypothetical protein